MIKITPPYSIIADTILKPTFNTSNKKQIYLTEQLFRSTYKFPFDYDQITTLMNCKRPSTAIEKFLIGRKFLGFSPIKQSFVEKKGAWFSILGKSPKHTSWVIFIRYFIFSISGASLGSATLYLSISHYIESSQPLDVYFIAAAIALLVSKP